MGSAGDPPAPVGDSPTGMAERNLTKRPFLLAKAFLPFRQAGRPTAQAGRLRYPETTLQTRSYEPSAHQRFPCNYFHDSP